MRREARPDFVAVHAEGRAVLVRDEIVHSEVMSARLEPAQHRAHVVRAAVRLDGAETSVLEHPVELLMRFVREKISEAKLCSLVHAHQLRPLHRTR